MVVVTGAAQGIGRDIAAAFSANGDNVVLLDHSGDAVEAAAAQMGARAYEVDVRDYDAVARCAGEVSAAVGNADVLVNNAGIMSRTSVLTTAPEEWRAVLETNVSGVFNCVSAFVPSMVERGQGWVVNIGSIWAGHVWPDRAAYSASKAAVEQFTRCFAVEVAPHGVRVNAISPGLMQTEMTAAVVQDAAFQATFMPRLGLRAAGIPSEHLAEVAVFLTTQAAGYMAGEIVEVHGGYY
ncbi:MAG TPA: SDR family oxidoreductase [Solirubrobacteraceae bacterium]|nr:SDR family oxidoreductase [Solirubrobacteraceae bacterium]